MVHREITSIENLLNEDRNFCSESYSNNYEIGGWHFQKKFPDQPKPTRRIISSLPPLVSNKKFKRSSEDLTSNNFLNTEAVESPENPSRLSANKFEIKNKFKFTEFKPLNDSTKKFNQKPSVDYIRMSIPRLKSLKRIKNSNSNASDCHKVNIEFSNLEHPAASVYKEKKIKKIIGLAYPPSYYEKFFISKSPKSTKNQSIVANYDTPLAIIDFSTKKYNFKGVKEFLKKFRAISLRSKSNLSIFP
jgi:hypothetical protein